MSSTSTFFFVLQILCSHGLRDGFVCHCGETYMHSHICKYVYPLKTITGTQNTPDDSFLFHACTCTHRYINEEWIYYLASTETTPYLLITRGELFNEQPAAHKPMSTIRRPHPSSSPFLNSRRLKQEQQWTNNNCVDSVYPFLLTPPPFPRSLPSSQSSDILYLNSVWLFFISCCLV